VFVYSSGAQRLTIESLCYAATSPAAGVVSLRDVGCDSSNRRLPDSKSLVSPVLILSARFYGNHPCSAFPDAETNTTRINKLARVGFDRYRTPPNQHAELIEDDRAVQHIEALRYVE
jgi:hypothetical protein